MSPTATTKRPKPAKTTTFSVTAEQLDAIDHDTDAQFAEIKAKGKSRAKTSSMSSYTQTTYTQKMVAIALIDDSPFQTRAEPSKAELQILAESLKTGLRDSPFVRKASAERYELIGGHRRIRAARLLGWKEIGVRIVEADDAQAAFLVLDDNEQHKALNAIERARGLSLVYDQYVAAGKSMRDMADERGIAQGTISNRIRMLLLPQPLLDRVIAGEITEFQLRPVVAWLSHPAVVIRFQKNLERDSPGDGPVMSEDIDAALVEAIKTESRPVAPVSLHYVSATDPLFPIDKHRAELDILTGKVGDFFCQNRAFNVELWDRLQKEARRARKAKQATDAVTAKSAPDGKTRTDRTSWEFQRCHKNAWGRALWGKIGECLEGNLSKKQKQTASRLLLLFGGRDSDWIIKSLRLSEDEYLEAALALLSEEWDELLCWNTDLSLITQISDFYFVEAASGWKPTKELLGACGLLDLADWATELKINAADYQGKLDAFVAAILDAWPTGWIPDVLSIAGPKPAKRAKR